MKELKLYQCEICKTQYNEKRKAVECEKSHLPYIAVMNSRYKPNGKYPETVRITFADKHQFIYYRGKELD